MGEKPVLPKDFIWTPVKLHVTFWKNTDLHAQILHAHGTTLGQQRETV